MNVYVCIKQVPDTETKVKLDSSGNKIDPAGIKWVMNPYDEYAVEEALKFKAANTEAKVKVISLGPKARIVEVLRTALAMGADEGIAIDGPDTLDAFATAKTLAAAINDDEGDAAIIFTGKNAIDNNNSSVTQMLAQNLNFPYGNVVSKLDSADGKYTIEREVEGGTKEIFELTGPSVIGANKGLNTPRYASLPGIMKAKKKPMKELEASALGFTDADVKVKLSNYTLPAERPAVKLLEGDPAAQTKELAKLLREEAKVL